MKRLLILSFVLLGLASCTKYEDHPLRPVSFEIGDRFYYSAKDTQVENHLFGDNPDPEVMNIRQYGDSLDISYSRGTDFLNYDVSGLGLYMKKIVAKFEEGVRMDFARPSDIQGYMLYYSVPYVYMDPIRSGSASDKDVYMATAGWIEFDEINFVSGTVSGRFEFEAVINDDEACSHVTEIEVRNGTFRNIPFKVSQSDES